MKKPIVLTIIDGLGISENKIGNAWKQAHTPVLDDLIKHYPHSHLQASGKAVGLPAGQIGNSEVGHLNIGAGQIVYTGLALIQKALDDHSFFHNAAFLKAIDHAQKNHTTLHLMGLLSDGGVHSLEKHLFALLDLAYKQGITKLSVHVFGDGRDVAPCSLKESLAKLMVKLDQYNYHLASICGRLYAMDRDQMFEKTQKAYDALRGEAKNSFTDPIAYIDQQYSENISDEFIHCATNGDKDVAFLHDNDSVIFFNFRPDRARQLAHLLVGSDLYELPAKLLLKNIQLTSMMRYEGIEKADVAFDAMEVKTPLGKIIAKAHLKQLRIAETQKYAHVTFFMDGGIDIQYPGSKRILVPSAKIDDFSQKPEMSASIITDKLLEVLDQYDLVIMNYANPDMVGHTGDLKATIKAVEVIDQELARIKSAVDQYQGTMFITADHGNAEIMLEDGKVVTKHTTSDVPLIVTDRSVRLKSGALANLAPTILDYMQLPVGSAMDHESLLIK